MNNTEFFISQVKKSLKGIAEHMVHLSESGKFDEILKSTEQESLKQANHFVDNKDKFCEIMAHHSNVNAFFMARNILQELESAFIEECTFIEEDKK